MEKASAEQAAAQWQAEGKQVYDRMVAGGGKPGVARTEEVAGLTVTGMQFMEGMLAGTQPYPHITDTLDFHLVEVGPGRAVFQGVPQLKHYNPLGTVHGGWYATLLDSALGCAVHTMMPAGRTYTTAELGVNIVRAASHKSGPLRAIGTVIHCGRQLATAEARIVGADGKLYAHATTTCLVFETPAR
jgi:uncharacterized protein (TIGR00369 family)